MDDFPPPIFALRFGLQSAHLRHLTLFIGLAQIHAGLPNTLPASATLPLVMR